MSILGLFLVGSLAGALGLVIALAFARTALYASVLVELDGARRVAARRRGLRRSAATELESIAGPAGAPTRESELVGAVRGRSG